jgi:hypothetical protein
MYWLRRWREGAGLGDDATGALFRGVRKNGALGPRLADREISRIYKELAHAAGLDAATVSGHSARTGMAVDLGAVFRTH